MAVFKILTILVVLCVSQQENVADVPVRASSSRARQYFHVEVENGLNEQITVELRASYTYQAMAYHFKQDTVALKGFHKMFKAAAAEEKEHAEKFMDYVVKRGGRVTFNTIERPDVTSWSSAVDAVQMALELEKTVTDRLMELHRKADQYEDPHLMDFLESEFLTEQVDSIKELADLVTNLRRVGEGLGEHVIDKELQ